MVSGRFLASEFMLVLKLAMPIDKKLSRSILERLNRELGKLGRKPAPERVHKFRTTSRRVEALLSEVVISHHGNEAKLLKRLARLRKKAGRLRDLDVEIAALRALRFPQGNGHKSQVMGALVKERAKREKKLVKAADRATIDEIRRRLRRSAKDFDTPANREPLALTLRKLRELSQSTTPLTEKTLHEYRIIGKRARYIAEFASDGTDRKRVVDQLKHMQDVIGDWHDWLKLSEKAEKILGGVRDSPLVAMLRNVTQAKYRQSLEAVREIRTTLPTDAHPVQSAPSPVEKAAAQGTAA
jgi:CHAD domain-containing protein